MLVPIRSGFGSRPDLSRHGLGAKANVRLIKLCSKNIGKVWKELLKSFKVTCKLWNQISPIYAINFFSDNVEVSEKDKALEKEPDEPLHWWELFAKLGEGMSRWLKAFITAQF